LKRSYKLLKSEQNELRKLLEDYLGPDISKKLVTKNTYQVVMQQVDNKRVIGNFNPKIEEIFEFYDNNQLHYIKMPHKQLKKLGDNAQQFENNMQLNKEMCGLFGYRIKKISDQQYKMRPTGNLGNTRIHFFPVANDKQAIHLTDEKGKCKAMPTLEAQVIRKGHTR
jgi:hypothetical protein